MTLPFSVRSDDPAANEFAAWLEQLAKKYRDSAEINLGGWGDPRNAWLAAHLGTLARSARSLQAESPDQFDERTEAMDQEWESQLRAEIKAACDVHLGELPVD